MKPEVLLLGGGYVLSELANQLSSKDFVITTTTPEKVTAFINRGYNAVQLNTLNHKEVSHFLKENPNFEVIVDSVPPQNLVSTTNPDELENMLTGVRNLTEELKTYDCKRLIYLSSTGVYGETRGKSVNEKSPVDPLSVKGLARLSSEKIYQELPFPSVSLRIAAICGPGRYPVNSLIAGKYPFIDGGKRYSNRIHVKDLVAVIKKTIESEGELPEVINCSDGHPVKTSKLVKYLCKKYHLNKPRNITYQEAQNHQMYTLLSNQKVSNRLLRKTFRYKFQYPGITWM